MAEFVDALVKNLRLERVRLYKDIREIEQSIEELLDNKKRIEELDG